VRFDPETGVFDDEAHAKIVGQLAAAVASVANAEAGLVQLTAAARAWHRPIPDDVIKARQRQRKRLSELHFAIKDAIARLNNPPPNAIDQELARQTVENLEKLRAQAAFAREVISSPTRTRDLLYGEIIRVWWDTTERRPVVAPLTKTGGPFGDYFMTVSKAITGTAPKIPSLRDIVKRWIKPKPRKRKPGKRGTRV
jgi:hypothetical protein